MTEAQPRALGASAAWKPSGFVDVVDHGWTNMVAPIRTHAGRGDPDPHW